MMNRYFLIFIFLILFFYRNSFSEEKPKNLIDTNIDIELPTKAKEETTNKNKIVDTNRSKEDQFDFNTDKGLKNKSLEESYSEQIVIDDIPQEFNDWYGVLSSQEGGLGWNMWGNTKHKDAVYLIKNFDYKINSPILRGVVNKMLLSRARSPYKETSSSSVINENKKELSFYEEKVRIFSMLNLKKSINELERSLPSNFKSKDLFKNMYKIRFNNLDLDYICNNIQNQAQYYLENYINRKILIGCKVAFNKTDEALLAIELLENEIEVEDNFLEFTRKYIEENKYSMDAQINFDNKEKLIVKMMSLRNENEAKKIFAKDKQNLDILIYDLKLYSQEAQVESLERLVNQGFYSGTKLKEAYVDLFQNKKDSIVNEKLDFLKMNTVLARAKIFVEAINAVSSSERAKYLNILWKKATEKNIYRALAVVTSELTLTIVPENNLSWFIYPAVKNLLASDNIVEAKNWLFYKSNDLFNRAAVDINFCRFLLLLYIKDKDINNYTMSMPSVEGLLDILLNDIEIREDQLYKLLVTLKSLDFKIPKGIWNKFFYLKDREVFTNNKKDFTIYFFALEDAILNKNKAESIIMAINILSYNNTKETVMQNLFKGLSGLNKIGLEKEARDYALEINFDILK